MKAKSFIAFSLCVLSVWLVGCTDRTVQTEEAEVPEQQQASPAASEQSPQAYVSGLEDAVEVVSTVAKGKSSALPLAGGESVSGTAVADRAGSIVGFGVTIGNYRNKSDGTLTLSLCQGGACQEAIADLPTSRNNELLHYKLSTPIAVSAGETIKFNLTHNAGAVRPVAVWTYPAPEGASTLIGVDGADTGRVAKFALYYQK